MARTKEYDRDKVLDIATQVFWVKGFKGTSISDLVLATGLGKRSMYQEFGSKEGMFRECINNYAMKMLNKVIRTLKQKPMRIRNIEAYFQMLIDHASSSECPGCLMVNSAIEKEFLEEEAFFMIKNNFSRVEDHIYQCLAAAQTKGEIAQEKDCRALAAFLFTFANGMMVRCKTSPKRESLAAMVETAFSSVKA